MIIVYVQLRLRNSHVTILLTFSEMLYFVMKIISSNKQVYESYFDQTGYTASLEQT